MTKKKINLEQLEQLDETTWQVGTDFNPDMRVPSRIIASRKLLSQMENGVVEQVTNLATLPGVVDYTLALPDAHWGYGAPIGGVFATDINNQGIISPGAIGFDINCGMRLIKTNLTLKDVKPHIPQLVDRLFNRVPTGVGSSNAIDKPTVNDFSDLLRQGAQWCLERDYAWEQDLEKIEDGGRLKQADAKNVSTKATQRGLSQIGTLGSGNHYLEIQVVREEDIDDFQLAKQLGIFPNQVTIMVHCGSRGLGHQVATDYLEAFEEESQKLGYDLPDQQLACAPFNSEIGQKYFSAMACAANMAFANRQVITHLVREVFARTFRADPQKDLSMELVYDVAHNIAKEETLAGTSRKLLIHRKGATRSLGPGSPLLPPIYKSLGQPVIIGGSMETGSYLLTGTNHAAKVSFSSTAHGSGRTMSRTQARKESDGKEIRQRLRDEKDIYVRSASPSGLAEEAGLAYKNIEEIIDVISQAGISRPVAKLTPLGNIKG